VRLSQDEVTSETFDEDLAALFASANDFTGFLTEAVGLPY
jgi:hypothetical protein